MGSNNQTQTSLSDVGQQGGLIDSLLKVIYGQQNNQQNQNNQPTQQNQPFQSPMDKANSALAIQLNPIQLDSLEKLYKKQSDVHAQEFMQTQGSDATAQLLALHGRMPIDNQQNGEGQGYQDLQKQGLASTPNQQPQPQSQLTMNPPSGPLAMGGASINPQGQVSVNQASPIMKFLLNWIGMGQNAFANQDINTISGAQSVAGQQPIQPIQTAEIGARVFGAQVDAMKNELAGHQDMLKSLSEEYNNVLKGPWWQKGDKLQNILSNIDTVRNNISTTLGKIRSLSSSAGNQSNKATPPKGATHYSPSQNKYYDAKGNEVK